MVYGVEGVWKELTLNVSPRSLRHPALGSVELMHSMLLQVNQMCANLTAQVRSIAGVTTAVAKVHLSPCDAAHLCSISELINLVWVCRVI